MITSYVSELARHGHGNATKKRHALRIGSYGFDELQVERQELQLDNLQSLNQSPLANQERYSFFIATEMGKPFQVRARTSKSEVVAEGLLVPAKKANQLNLAVSIAEIYHSGVKISNPGEKDIEIKDRTGLKSSPSLELEKTAILGGMITRLDDGSEKSKPSVNLFRVRVTDLQPK